MRRSEFDQIVKRIEPRIKEISPVRTGGEFDFGYLFVSARLATSLRTKTPSSNGVNKRVILLPKVVVKVGDAGEVADEHKNIIAARSIPYLRSMFPLSHLTRTKNTSTFLGMDVTIQERVQPADSFKWRDNLRLIEQVDTLANIIGWYDSHFGNWGIRKNGSLVIFDVTHLYKPKFLSNKDTKKKIITLRTTIQRHIRELNKQKG